jgi:hypothetical protein
MCPPHTHTIEVKLWTFVLHQLIYLGSTVNKVVSLVINSCRRRLSLLGTEDEMRPPISIWYWSQKKNKKKKKRKSRFWSYLGQKLSYSELLVATYAVFSPWTYLLLWVLARKWLLHVELLNFVQKLPKFYLNQNHLKVVLFCAWHYLVRQYKRTTYDSVQNCNWWKMLVLLITGFIGGNYC